MEDFQRAMQKEKILSCLVLQHDQVIFEYYKNKKIAGKLQKINSCTKSVISALIGIALDKGLLEDVHTPIREFFPELLRDPDPRKQEITIDHLLTMTAGFDWPEFGEWNSFAPMVYSSNWVKWILDRPLADHPGERMNYNSGCSHVLTAILQKVSRMKAARFAVQYLFRPQGIGEYHFYEDNKGINRGADGLCLTTEGMARFGSLYLHRGKSVVPPEWVAESTRGRYLTYENIGQYGSHWWARKEQGYFFALGFGGQYIIVVPDRNAVVVMTSEMYEASLKPMGYFEQLLLPAL